MSTIICIFYVFQITYICFKIMSYLKYIENTDIYHKYIIYHQAYEKILLLVSQLLLALKIYTDWTVGDTDRPLPHFSFT